MVLVQFHPLRPANTDQPVNPDDSARMRDLLASNRTLPAWDRTAISFAGLTGDPWRDPPPSTQSPILTVVPPEGNERWPEPSF
ncbi:MAG: hypothetical protein QOJ73_3309 [Streptosporangiaceae bacterium]|jgi:hypothetical protein|nr:hypothetical protein [Streptosporangiaceae bacterium]